MTSNERLDKFAAAENFQSCYFPLSGAERYAGACRCRILLDFKLTQEKLMCLPAFTPYRAEEFCRESDLEKFCGFEENRLETFAQKWWPAEIQSPQGALFGGAGG